MNLDFIRQRLEHRVYTWDDCLRLVETVSGILMQVLSVERRKETIDMWKTCKENFCAPGVDQPTAFCHGLEFLMNRVNMLRIDDVNDRWVVVVCGFIIIIHLYILIHIVSTDSVFLKPSSTAVESNMNVKSFSRSLTLVS
jgi:hypothetical protein